MTGWNQEEAVAGVLSRRGDSDDVRERPSQTEDHHVQPACKPNDQVVNSMNEKKQGGMDSTLHIDSKVLEQGQSENDSSIMTDSNTHVDKLMLPSREHFTHFLSSPATPISNSSRTTSTSSTKKAQSGHEPTGSKVKSSRHCHPICFAGFALPSSHHAYMHMHSGSLNDAWPLLEGKSSTPLSSMITERHPFSLGYDSFFDDSISDEEDD